MTLTEDEKKRIRLEYKAAKEDSKSRMTALRLSAYRVMNMLENIFGKKMFTKI